MGDRRQVRRLGDRRAADRRVERALRETFEGGVAKRGALVLSDDRYELQPLTWAADWSIFVSCLNVTNWRTEHGYKPYAPLIPRHDHAVRELVEATSGLANILLPAIHTADDYAITANTLASIKSRLSSLEELRRSFARPHSMT